MSYPKRCYECGGKVAPVAQAGRTMLYKNMAAVAVPAELAIPTCDTCGEMFFDEALDTELDEALEAAYQAKLHEFLTAAVGKVRDQTTLQELENLVGLSQGYLSKVQQPDKKTSAVLTAFMVLLAEDPAEGVAKLQRLFGTKQRRRTAENAKA